ncbi:MAG TPA: prepilin-type N-terminal cleavage/methylation domain-containing protein [Thermoanaerobaculia bacterium]|nr:prepilin-type N-terminal cleavage/methylation domain-containing protein [Thermoanaerobaculia bacterium]
MRPTRKGSAGQSGFTLIEISIALLLLMLGLMLAAQLLMETSKLFAETSGEASDTPVPLVLARIRGDVQGSAAAAPVLLMDGSLAAITMVGGPDGEIVYAKQGTDLFRSIVPATGEPPGPPVLLWRGVTAWSCQVVPGTNLVDLQVTYRRRSVPHTPLAVLPAYRGSLTEELTQRMYLLPRGGGLGDTW